MLNKAEKVPEGYIKIEMPTYNFYFDHNKVLILCSLKVARRDLIPSYFNEIRGSELRKAQRMLKSMLKSGVTPNHITSGNRMETVLKALQGWFIEKKEHFIQFAKTQRHIEGWIKGELIVLLNRLFEYGLVEQFIPELSGVDFGIWVDDVIHPSSISKCNT